MLSIDVIPREALESDPYDPINKFGYVFSYVGDLNNDEIEDKAIVGVYEDKSWEFGRFLLIMTRINNKWKKSFVSKIPGKPGFSILWPKGVILFWSLYMECGSHGELNWNGKEYEVK